MTTSYSLIYDLFLMQIKDWKLDTLYASSVTDFETYLQGFLVLAIPGFTEFCDQSLARDDGVGEFTEDLTDKNKIFLSQMMTERWLDKEVQDIRQVNLHVTDKDFKTYSEGQNLREKSNYLVLIREKISQSLVEYAWYGKDMTNWLAGTFIEA